MEGRSFVFLYPESIGMFASHQLIGATQSLLRQSERTVERAKSIGREPLFGYLLVIGVIEDDRDPFTFDRMGVLPIIGVGNTFEIECLPRTIKTSVCKKC